MKLPTESIVESYISVYEHHFSKRFTLCINYKIIVDVSVSIHTVPCFWSVISFPMTPHFHSLASRLFSELFGWLVDWLVVGLPQKFLNGWEKYTSMLLMEHLFLQCLKMLCTSGRSKIFIQLFSKACPFKTNRSDTCLAKKRYGNYAHIHKEFRGRFIWMKLILQEVQCNGGTQVRRILRQFDGTRASRGQQPSEKKLRSLFWRSQVELFQKRH